MTEIQPDFAVIENIIQNPVYIARNEIHKKNKGKSDASIGQEYKFIKTDKWKPIIKEDEFNKVQQLLSVNRKAKSKPVAKGSYDFLMSDLLYCEHCNHGKDLGDRAALTHGGTTKNGKLIPHYIHRKGCRNEGCPLPHSISAERLDEVIWSKLVKEHTNTLNEAVLKQAYLEHENSDIPRRQQEIAGDIAELKKLISERETEHSNILKSLGTGIGNTGKLTAEFLTKLSEDVESLKSQLSERQNEFASLQEMTSIDSQVAKVLKCKKKSFSNLPADQKIALAKVLLKRIVLRDSTLVLEQRVGDPIMGILKEFQRKDGKESISHPWRFVEVEWVG